ncbi:MAG: hypothetical protein JHC98_10585 [Thermoleophilaceae bacterium]|nr:hypothetical protein [Thermoleophilaceae bacterium]
MNNRSAQHAYPRLPARALSAALAACACLLMWAGSASAAAPSVTIGSFPPLNETDGTFSFDADGPLLKFQCKLDAGSFGDCSAPLTLFNLSVSTHTFSVRAIGLDNSIGEPATYTWTIDITRPAVPLLTAPADNLLTNNPTPTFSGSAEPFAHVPVFDGSTQLANPQAGADGVWSYTPASALDDGTHLWRVRAIDASGNRSDFTALRTLRVDTQAPAAPVVNVPADAAKVNTRTPQISGTAEPLSTVAVSDGPTRICTTAAEPSGAWSCVSSEQLLDGPHVLNVAARDAAGNESPTVQRAFELDATAPATPTLDTPIDGFATTATSITVGGTASPISAVKVLVNGVEVADETAGPDGNWSHTFSALEENDYAFSAKEVDDFGNRSAASNVANVRVDRTPPAVTVATHPPLRANQTDALFGLLASEPNVEFECALDGGGWLPCGASPGFTGLSADMHSFKARATDRAGNVGDDSAVFTWTIDLTPPAAPMIESPADGALVTTARPGFAGYAEEGAAVELFADGGSLGTVPANAITGAWALTPGSSLSQGLVQVKARAIDEAGNIGPYSATRELTIDSIAPVTTLLGAPTAPTRADTVTVTFTADDPQATFSCRLDASAFAPCTSPYATPLLSEATHTVQVRAKDTAGNVELPAQSVSFVVDRTAPVGQSTLIAGSAGSDGIPKFQIASNEPSAVARCKIDNGVFVNCSGQYKPSTTPGIHALTIRFTDAAGNSDDQVFAFSVVPVTNPPAPPPTPPAPDAYEQPTPAKACKILGVTGLTSGRLRIARASGSGRALKLTLSSGAAGIVRVDVTAGGSVLGSAPFAVKAGTSKLSLKLKRTPAAGSTVALAVRFYSVKREFGTARLSLAVRGTALRPTSGAQSTLDAACPAVEGGRASVKFTVTGAAAGSGRLKLSSNGKLPALIAMKVFRGGTSLPVVNTLFAVGAGSQKVSVKLLGGSKLEKGGYKFTFDSLGPGGKESAGRGAFLAR